MVNLLRFTQPDGLEHYYRYGAEIAPLLQQAGATVRYAGSSPVFVIGEGQSPWWERPSRSGTRSCRTDCDVVPVTHTSGFERGR
jgi:hypothetical protein